MSTKKQLELMAMAVKILEEMLMDASRKHRDRAEYLSFRLFCIATALPSLREALEKIGGELDESDP